MPETNFLFPKGSEWRKWDLHIHAPSCALNNNFEGSTDEEKWDNYIQKLESFSDFSVLGITDYFSIEGYLKIREEKEKGRLQNIDCILPNVEIRLLPVTDQNNPINIHVIFDPVVTKSLNSHFFQNLTFTYGDNEYRCDREGLVRLGRKYKDNTLLDERVAYCEGINQFKVPIGMLREVLRRNLDLKGHYLVVVSNRSGDGNSGIQHSNMAATRQEIYRISQMIFSSNPSDRDFFLGKGVDSSEDVVKQYGSLKPCVHGSDGHSLDTICRPDQNRYTWIKADPTFDGLKQIVYEPEDRVVIMEYNPREDHPKSHFSKILAKGSIFRGDSPEFSDNILPINDNMVTIIGGRGTGKSLLLDVLHHTFYEPALNLSPDPSSRGRLARIAEPEFQVVMTKSDDEKTPYRHADRPNQFQYLHVRQGDVKEIAEDPKKLAEVIKYLLGYIEEDVDEIFEEEVEERNSQIDKINQWFKQKDEEGNQINKISFNERKKIQSKKLIETVTTKETKDKIEDYIHNTQISNQITKLVSDVRAIQHELQTFQKETNARIEKFNEQKLLKGHVISIISFEKQNREIENIIEAGIDRIKEIGDANKVISEELAEKGIKGDISGQLDKVEAYQREIDQCDSRIADIEDQVSQLSKLKHDIISSADTIIEQIENRRSRIDAKFKEKSKGTDSLKPEHKELLSRLLRDVEINGIVFFDKMLFYQRLKEFFDGRKLRNRRIESICPIKKYSDFFKLIRGEEIISSDSSTAKISLQQFTDEADLFLSDDRSGFLDFFYSEKERKEYLKVLPSIKYKNKEPEKLSVGQRGTFFVCLKLATEAFTTPFIFDQPEDDLDNEFIVTELQPIFREIKKYRQVIIVTHNANLVVNADAEQIIVARNDDEIISFKSGSLENPWIRDEICRILEGGKAAFLKRELRYDLARENGIMITS